MGKGGGTHTHILLLATAEEAGGTSGWSGVYRSLLLLFLFSVVVQRARPFSLWRERERGRRVTPQPACVAHTTQRERDGSRMCPILLLLFRRSRREERYWLVGSVGSSVCCLVVVLARGGERGGGSTLPRRQAEAHITPRTSNNARS